MRSALAPGMTIAIERSHATSPMSMEAERCKTCNEFLVYTPDAIGRLRARCPRCQGVAKQRPRPNAVLVPMTLAEVERLPQLPPITPGQLRCQRCARGVARRVDRFCAECRPLVAQESRALRLEREKGQPRSCACGVTFTPTFHRQRTCPDCKTARKRAVTKALWSGATRFAPRTCACGAIFAPRGPSSYRCDACREQRRRLPSTRPPRTFATKRCAGCDQGFTPAGSRQIWCTTCRPPAVRLTVTPPPSSGGAVMPTASPDRRCMRCGRALAYRGRGRPPTSCQPRCP
jgi:phage FluMu protein Com